MASFLNWGMFRYDGLHVQQDIITVRERRLCSGAIPVGSSAHVTG